MLLKTLLPVVTEIWFGCVGGDSRWFEELDDFQGSAPLKPDQEGVELQTLYSPETLVFLTEYDSQGFLYYEVWAQTNEDAILLASTFDVVEAFLEFYKMHLKVVIANKQ